MYKSFIKRLIDILLVIPGLIILLIIFVPVSIMIYFDDKGPLLYNALRLGKDGKIFKMYKFRSMKVNAPDIRKEDGSTFNSINDERLTRIGRFIRKTSIDELPQLINVLKGEMSLVGPRPSLPHEVEKFETWMMRRLEVKPGLTCYWQVAGRNNIDFEEWMQLDVDYVNDRNLGLDIKLIFKTFFVLFGDKNAH